MTYYARELTDPAGGALTITTDHQGVWITATEGRDEVTVGPFPATTLADDMDGGVTAALIEEEVSGSYTGTAEQADPVAAFEFWKGAANIAKRRAEKAEKERDEARATKNMHKERADRERARADAAEQPHPLTADDVDGDMMNRALNEARSRGHRLGIADMRHILDAALTPPPTRPEGAEEIEAALRTEWTFDDDAEFTDLADRLARRLRVTKAES